ncbi:MAG TPA: hypothetical protein G4N98_07145 [Thermoflexia bacterium]|nr:hypothetical protein [Thermoflexia bacterium]
MGTQVRDKSLLKMHSTGWWELALAERLTPAEKHAWQQHLATCPRCQAEWSAWLEVEALFKSTPVPAPPEGFADRTLARLEHARRRRYAVGLLSAFFLILLVWLLILTTGSNYLRDILNVGDVLLTSRELLLQTLMRVWVSASALKNTLLRLLLGISALLYFSLIFNGTLAATATLVLVNKRRSAVYLE